MAATANVRLRSFSLGALLAKPASWLVLIVLLVVSLAIGSVHRAPPTASQRVTFLDSVIKCPPCSGLSIAQSEVPQAKALRSSVGQWVAQGLSNAAIEARVVQLYGQDEILRPTNPVVWIAPLLAFGLALVALVVMLARRSRRDHVLVSESDVALVAAARGQFDDERRDGT
jgi:cytochrome c-type biogenesis protein CcmH/NrfF